MLDPPGESCQGEMGKEGKNNEETLLRHGLIGKQRIAAHVPAGSIWDGEISVYGKEQFDTLRQLGILPGEAEKGGNV